MSVQFGPTLNESQRTHALKYRAPGESFSESMSRIASGLKDNDQHYHDFRDILLDQAFMPGGRIQSAIGSPRIVTPYNCFVSGTIEDSFIDGEGSVMQRASEAAQTMRLGGGIGYDFSTLRPKGALIKSLQSTSSGPLAFMEIFNSVCGCVASAGHRRGAQMGVLRIDHPDVEAYIHAKQNTSQFTNFNLSLGVTDKFMECLKTGEPFPLQFKGEVYNHVNAGALWEMVMRSTWDWAEPGVLFIDTINKMNNLWYCEYLAATNPCAEQPLPPYGACLLGSFNLTKFVRRLTDGRYVFDYAAFQACIPIVVRAMDNVVDRAVYPLPQQAEEARNKRRMGIGVTGTANAIEAVLGRGSYGDDRYIAVQNEILRVLTHTVYRASIELAKEKGAFPLFDRDKYTQSEFIKTLPSDIREGIYRHGIRNSHLTSIAPCGTISLCADNVSSSIEPVFALDQSRDVIEPQGKVRMELPDYGWKRFGIAGRVSADVTVDQHLAVLANAQRYMDSAVSKTCNIPGGSMGWDDFKSVYERAYYMGCKGVTTFNPDGKRMAMLTAKKPESEEVVEGTACYIDPVTGNKSCE